MELPRSELCWRIYEPSDLVICSGQGCAAGRTGLQRRSMMTMWPRSGRAVPTMTAQVARAAFPKGCLAIRIRDALGELFEDGAVRKTVRGPGPPGGLTGAAGAGVGAAVCRGAVGPPGRRRGPRPDRLEVRPGLGACRHWR